MDLIITKKKDGEGKEYYNLSVCTTFIGRARPFDGGFIAQGRKKPVPTLEDVAKQLLDAHMNFHTKEHRRYHKLLKKILSKV